MTSWIARHSEALWEASQALRKVEKEFGKKKEDPGRPGQTRQGYAASSQSGSGWQETPQSRQENPVFDDAGRLPEDDEEGDAANQDDGWTWDQYGWEDWSRHSNWSQHSWRAPEYEPPSTWDSSSDIFIPEFLAGFLLLHRAGLDNAEKSNILAAVRGEFSVESISRALREQWADDELAKRDRQKMGSAMMAEDDFVEDDGDDTFHLEEDAMEIQHLEAGDREAFLAAQAEAEEALEALKTQKATLKEARWKQKQIKLGRGYFPPKPFPKGAGGKGGTPNRTGIKCFRCDGPHLARDCPKAKESRFAEEEAHFAYWAEEVEKTEWACPVWDQGSETMGENHKISTTKDMIDTCYGIIDSGATASLGSIQAMEAVMLKNLEGKGESGMRIDTSNKPTFRFGNGQTRGCISTAQVNVRAGEQKGQMTVHVHDVPNQPVLISRRALESLGAVIDFEEKIAVYKRVDPTKTVPLREAENGHLLMPLTGDLLEGHMSRGTPFVSLSTE